MIKILYTKEKNIIMLADKNCINSRSEILRKCPHIRKLTLSTVHKCILTKLAYICFLASSFDFTQLVGPQFLSKKREKRSFLNISQRSKLLKLIKKLRKDRLVVV